MQAKTPAVPAEGSSGITSRFPSTARSLKSRSAISSRCPPVIHRRLINTNCQIVKRAWKHASVTPTVSWYHVSLIVNSITSTTRARIGGRALQVSNPARAAKAFTVRQDKLSSLSEQASSDLVSIHIHYIPWPLTSERNRCSACRSSDKS